MTRHLLLPVLINASGKLSCIASRGNQTTKFFNNLLNNFIQVVKRNEDLQRDLSKRSTTSSFNSPNRNYSLINVKTALNKAADAIPAQNVILASLLIFFQVNLSCGWIKTLIGHFEVLILPFKRLFSILSALISSDKSEFDGRDMFSLFIQYEWPSVFKGIADQL